MIGTQFDQNKLTTVAIAARFVASSSYENWDSTIARQMVGEGLRKLHDCACSFRGRGKYLGHAHWSRNAIKLLDGNNGIVRGITRQLSHEHVIPVTVVLDILLKNNSTKPLSYFKQQIRRYSVVAIITRDEEKTLSEKQLGNSMPEDWEACDNCDVWARYKSVGLYKFIQPVPT